MTQRSQPLFRILYIEDNSLMREITSELLASEHRDVVAVGSAESALAAIRGERFDIVITDVNLPQMSGVDLCREIQQLAPSTPVILASGHSLDVAGVELGERVRAIRKPFETQQLDALIEELCRGASA